jgi:type VI secretion system protein ImpM
MSGPSLATDPKPAGFGFYGKAVTHGDFILRNLPSSFLSPWDEWLQSAIFASKSQLGDECAEFYRTSPIWRFALSSGICGDQVAAGILMPSVDSVGRYYPMTMVSLCSAPTVLFRILMRGEKWFVECEEAALTCLEESFAVETLEKRLESIGNLSEVVDVSTQEAETSSTIFPGGMGVHSKKTELDSIWEELSPELMDTLARNRFESYSLWWTIGSHLIDPAIIIRSGLPEANEFVTFLRGTQESG